MSATYDVQEETAVGVVQAIAALQQGRLVVLPTDTVYGIAADAFSPEAVEALLAAKGRGRDMPVPVLVGSLRGLDGLAADVTPTMRALVQAHWPGPLTLIVPAAPSPMARWHARWRSSSNMRGGRALPRSWPA